MNLKDQVRKFVAFDEHTFKISDEEKKLRSNLDDPSSLPARDIGYSWGARDENSRLAPLLELLPEIVESLDVEELEGEFEANGFQGGEYNNGAGAILKRWISANKETLAKIKEAVGKSDDH